MQFVSPLSKCWIGLLLVAAPLLPAEAPPSLPALFLPSVYEPGDVKYLAVTPTMMAAFSPTGVTFRPSGRDVSVHFAGANPDAVPRPRKKLRAKVNFLLGEDERRWRTEIPTFAGIVYPDLYAGITLRYFADGARLKSEWTVEPGADPAEIRLQYSGEVELGDDGSLHVSVGGQRNTELIERSPLIYQEVAGIRKTIPGSYRVTDSYTVGYVIGEYDPSLPLIIDPTITYSTYLGGIGTSAVTGIAVDSGGNSYVTGSTDALDFPIVGAVQAVNGGSLDAFVAKFNSTGTTLLYATYIGGHGYDYAAAIAVDSSGQAYVAGSTSSSNFPLVSSLTPYLVGTRTAFALKLNAIGNTLLYSTYLGGTAYEVGTAIAVDASGNMYVAGDTQSINFPVSGGVQAVNAGGFDAFVTKINSSGAIVFSTYLGGSLNEHTGGIAVDSGGNVYVAGGTYSTNFPTRGAIQSLNAGGQDAFITKLSANGSQILYSTYLGGSGPSSTEQANGVAVDGNGNAYIAGVTNSINFPVTTGAVQTSYGGSQDAFAAKLNSTGSALVYATFLGGTALDWANGIAVDPNGNAYIAGYTQSINFPTVGGLQSGPTGISDAFVSEFNASGTGILFSTYYGGSGSDTANAIAVDANGNMFVGGQTGSSDFPLRSQIQSANSGNNAGWTARIGVTPPSAQTPAVVSVTPSSGSGNTATLIAQFSDTAGGTSLSTVSILINSSASTSFGCYITYTSATDSLSLANDDPSTGSLAVTIGGGTQQNNQCVVNGTGSSISVSGNTLTLTVPLTFLPPFAGSKTVFLYAADSGANTGFVSKGSWNVVIPAPLPSADTVSPNAGSGANQTFTFVFSDTQSAANLTGAAILIQSSVTFSNACYIVFDRIQGTVALVFDSGLGSSSKPIGSSTSLSNSQCTLGAATTQISGLSLILTVSLTFRAAFGGARNIYMYGVDGSLNTGWVQRGTFFVLAGGAPVATSVVPGSGSGPSQRFTFTVTDVGGSSYLTGLAALIASSFNPNNACNLVYDRNTNRVSLSYDNASNGASPVTPGSSTVVANSQCSLKGANTTVTFTTTQLIVTMDLSFNSTFFGGKNIYLYAAEATANSGWSTVGGWTVTGGAPTADSVSPASGSGPSQAFTFTVSDSVAQSNITGMSMLFINGSPTNLANACYLVYDRSATTIGLYNDAGTSFSTKGIGSSATLQNSQCAVGYTVMNTSGNSVLFTINLVFKSAFNGSKSVYLQANEPSVNSGWVLRGSWTVQ